MSAQDAPSAAEIVTVVTFLIYEYLITLDQEIKLFWKRGFTGASALFLFVRYSTLICYDILGAISFARLSDNVRALYIFSTRFSLTVCCRVLSLGSALLCFNVLDLALSVIAFVTPIHSGSYVTALTDPLTAVLVCRFLMDLQAANVSSMNDSHIFESTDHPTTGVGSLVFARVIGSMGAQLGPDHTTTNSTLDQGSDDEPCGISLSSLRSAAVGETRDIEEVPVSG
ncbi:hypothetical protein TRAPUB_9792 [Trametes pubescens]|uniref:DUF6533 domain-containing protein n=1 Tax=Trametes pubescens TaxID=154538 RepID=A0A1M2W1N3_TRAPU|nr:hypothetical protein TRAPUB_9792 [Trametes pubescens]